MSLHSNETLTKAQFKGQSTVVGKSREQKLDAVDHITSTIREPSHIDCAGLNEGGFHRFIYWKAWSPVGGTVWEGLGGMDLLEEVRVWVWV